jgi:hypothetical protein
MVHEVVVAIRYQTGAGLVAYLESNSPDPNAGDVVPLQLSAEVLPSLDTVANVQKYGNQIRDALSRHPAIKHELVSLFGRALPERSMLLFFINGPKGEGERYRWETLCGTPTRFLAVDDACTISRVTSAQKNPVLRAFSYPLRMAAFLSAAGIPAKDEFYEICRQIAAARDRGLDIECKVFLGEQNFLDALQQQKLPGIEVAPIPSTAVEIGTFLQNASIQFLHFFCHGVEAVVGVQALALATINDHDKNNGKSVKEATSSIRLGIDRLTTALSLNRSIWITTFNSCSGAAQVLPQLHSMALTVAKQCCPYTVGMAEPMDSADAPAFSEAFYAELFAIVGKSLAGAGKAEVILDLAPAIVAARKSFHDRYLDQPCFGRWAVPLVYQRNQQPLMVLAVDAAMAERIQEVARALQAMPGDTPIDLRDKLLEILDKHPKVPREFRPNRYGTLT